MQCHEDNLTSQHGHKYELNRAIWTIYWSFNDMYNHNYNEIEVTRVTKYLDDHKW